MKLNSVNAIRLAAHKAGNHWFNQDVVRLFNSRISETAYPSPDGSCYFVTSERQDSSCPRLYSVRRAFYGEGGRFRIETVGEFQGYRSRSGAHKAAQRIAKRPPLEEYRTGAVAPPAELGSASTERR